VASKVVVHVKVAHATHADAEKTHDVDVKTRPQLRLEKTLQQLTNTAKKE